MIKRRHLALLVVIFASNINPIWADDLGIYQAFDTTLSTIVNQKNWDLLPGLCDRLKSFLGSRGSDLSADCHPTTDEGVYNLLVTMDKTISLLVSNEQRAQRVAENTQLYNTSKDDLEKWAVLASAANVSGSIAEDVDGTSVECQQNGNTASCIVVRYLYDGRKFVARAPAIQISTNGFSATWQAGFEANAAPIQPPANNNRPYVTPNPNTQTIRSCPPDWDGVGKGDIKTITSWRQKCNLCGGTMGPVARPINGSEAHCVPPQR